MGVAQVKCVCGRLIAISAEKTRCSHCGALVLRPRTAFATASGETERPPVAATTPRTAAKRPASQPPQPHPSGLRARLKWIIAGCVSLAALAVIFMVFKDRGRSEDSNDALGGLSEATELADRLHKVGAALDGVDIAADVLGAKHVSAVISVISALLEIYVGHEVVELLDQVAGEILAAINRLAGNLTALFARLPELLRLTEKAGKLRGERDALLEERRGLVAAIQALEAEIAAHYADIEKIRALKEEYGC